ncbi:hypothetical protein [Mycolicibacterium sp.]|uniref:hypothetical protein n=1 Tax=Mycolicibacterium sp. TaxID=2320850 RepID=UPI0025EE6799|nr:hypothetical protein [Mycolicibacterium sp.]
MRSVPVRPVLVPPAYANFPEYVETLGPEVCELAALAGLPPDPEQEMALNVLFALSPNPLVSAVFEFALICARQNMKTALFQQAALGWLFVTDQRLVVWSSHEMDTTNEAFEDIVNMIEGTPVLSKRLDPDFGKDPGIKRGNGKELIKLRPSDECPYGQRIKFKARTKGGARGLTGNKIILDEAYALKRAHMGSLLPTLSAVKDPQVVYGSSAGHADSEVLRGIRDRGRAGSSPRLGYMEFCAPTDTCESPTCTHALSVEGCALDDIEMVRLANPALERRITLGYIQAEREALPPAEFARERLGWWDEPDTAGESVIGPELWAPLADPLSEPIDPVAFGVYVKLDRTQSAIGVVGRRADGKLHVGVVPAVRGKAIDSLPGTAWIPDRVRELAQEWKPCAVVIDPHSAAGSLITTIEGLGVEVVKSNATDLTKACGAFYDAVTADRDSDDSLRHRGAGPLARAVTSAKKRELSDAWAWDRKDRDSDITQLMAVTLALHGFTEFGARATVDVDAWQPFWT